MIPPHYLLLIMLLKEKVTQERTKGSTEITELDLVNDIKPAHYLQL